MHRIFKNKCRSRRKFIYKDELKWTDGKRESSSKSASKTKKQGVKKEKNRDKLMKYK